MRVYWVCVGGMVFAATFEAFQCFAHLMCKRTAVVACEDVWLVFVRGYCAPLFKNPYGPKSYKLFPIFSSSEAKYHRRMGLSFKVFWVSQPMQGAGVP